MKGDDRAYAALFESAPVSIWHEDFSSVKALLDEVVQSAGGDLDTYLQQHADIVYDCMRRVRVLQVNRLAREFYGASTQEELVRRLPELFDDGSVAVFREELVALASGAERFESEVTTRTLDGEDRIVQMNVSVLPTPSKPWSQVIVAFTDVTERKRLERELLQSQKLESLGRMAGGLAHDLNNALTIIDGYSDMLLGEVSQPDPIYMYLYEIKKAGERAAALVQPLLAFSRKQVLQPKVVNLNSIVAEAKNVLRTATGEHIRLVLQLAPTLRTTRVDPAQVYHVLLNLVLNARDAMPDGGALEIETQNVVICEGRTEMTDLGPGTYVALTVRDTGTGMDEETRRRVFEPFFTTKEVGKGTGLGLSSAFGIIKQSGGWMRAASQLGSGSEFTVYLPAFHDHEQTDGAREHAVADLRGSGTILLVEDEPEVRCLLTEALGRYGYRVLSCGDPFEALAIFDSHRASIQIVITDVVMPGMTGPQLVEKLLRSAGDLMAVYISGYANSPELREQALGGHVAYLQKPFGPDALALAVKRLLDCH
jgi:two-component system cell cycle sensor histidine kinase/response regulator CckA